MFNKYDLKKGIFFKYYNLIIYIPAAFNSNSKRACVSASTLLTSDDDDLFNKYASSKISLSIRNCST